MCMAILSSTMAAPARQNVVELVRKVRAKVKADSGYILEPEVLLVGQSWDEVLGE